MQCSMQPPSVTLCPSCPMFVVVPWLLACAPLAALLLSEQVQVCISRSTRLNIAAQGGKSKLKETETSKVELILIYLLWRGQNYLILTIRRMHSPVLQCCAVDIVVQCVEQFVLHQGFVGRPAYHDPQDWWLNTLSSLASSLFLSTVYERVPI